MTASLLRGGATPVPVCAHRGHSAGAPENTLAALAMAAELDAAWCEIDTVRCADGLVVMHDDLLDRTTDGRGPVRKRTMSEIGALDAGSWFGAEFKGERAPSLREVLCFAREHGLGLVVEAKERYAYDTDELMTMIGAVLRETEMTECAVVASFDQTALCRAKAILPWLRTELIATGQFLDPVGVARAAGADVLSFDLKRFHPEDARALRQAGIAVRVSLPSTDEFDLLEGYGFGIVERLIGWLEEGLIDILSSADTSRAVWLAREAAGSQSDGALAVRRPSSA